MDKSAPIDPKAAADFATAPTVLANRKHRAAAVVWAGAQRPE